MSEINASNFKKEHGDLAPDLVGVSELTSPYFFVPPSGTTAERPEDCEPGTLRFNTDIGTLEVFRGDTIGWVQILKRESQYLGGGTPNITTSTNSNRGTGVRGITAGGNTPSLKEEIEFITISTFGNSQDFGDLIAGRGNFAGLCSSTRGVFAGGTNPSNNIIDFVTIASTGNAIDFGDMFTGDTAAHAGTSNQTRGVFMGGDLQPSNAFTNTMQHITIEPQEIHKTLVICLLLVHMEMRHLTVMVVCHKYVRSISICQINHR